MRPSVGEPAEDAAVVGRRQSEPVAAHPDPAAARLGRAPRPDAALARGQAGAERAGPEPERARLQKPPAADGCPVAGHGFVPFYSGGSRNASSRPGWPLPLVATTMYCTPSST